MVRLEVVHLAGARGIGIEARSSSSLVVIGWRGRCLDATNSCEAAFVRIIRIGRIIRVYNGYFCSGYFVGHRVNLSVDGRWRLSRFLGIAHSGSGLVNLIRRAIVRHIFF